MDSTMKAAVVREFGKPLVIEEVPVPRPAAGDILVKIEACGVCHTDLHAAEGDWPVKPNPPFIPGHEGVGHLLQREAVPVLGERPAEEREVVGHAFREISLLDVEEQARLRVALGELLVPLPHDVGKVPELRDRSFRDAEVT